MATGAMIFGLTPGLLGLLSGLVSGAMMGARLLRDQPWDVHDENSYAEPTKLSIGALAPTVIFFVTLLTTVLGLAAIDRDVNPGFGLAGDGLGIINLLLTVAYLFVGIG